MRAEPRHSSTNESGPHCPGGPRMSGQTVLPSAPVVWFSFSPGGQSQQRPGDGGDKGSLCPPVQSGALSLVGIVEILLSLVESFIELKYFYSVATPALLCHKEPARRLGACSSLVLYGIRDRWLQCTERSYYRRPYAIKNQRGASP